jgi:hypothetical protein
MKRVLFGLVFFVPLYRQYRTFCRVIAANAQTIYNRRIGDDSVTWAREYLTRRYLEKHYCGYWEWVRRVHDGS